jgi:hypothetical protein
VLDALTLRATALPPDHPARASVLVHAAQRAGQGAERRPEGERREQDEGQGEANHDIDPLSPWSATPISMRSMRAREFCLEHRPPLF